MKHKNFLRDLSKFLSGLVVGDILVWIWFYTSHRLPITFLGVAFGESALLPGLVFDCALLVILYHYGWHAEVMSPSIKSKTLFKIVGVVFLIVALLHLGRIMFNWNIVLGSWPAPIWLSWVGFFIAGFLGYSSFVFGRKQS